MECAEVAWKVGLFVEWVQQWRRFVSFFGKVSPTYILKTEKNWEVKKRTLPRSGNLNWPWKELTSVRISAWLGDIQTRAAVTDKIYLKDMITDKSYLSNTRVRQIFSCAFYWSKIPLGAGIVEETYLSHVSRLRVVPSDETYLSCFIS
jgi:hypothetical protein